MVSRIGIVLLIGIVVNNAIVLVDHINQLKGTGINLKDTVLHAGVHRFRPIIMTAATTLLGLTPMAMAKSCASGSMCSTMAITVISGLAVSTILTLLVIPLVYYFFDSIQNVFSRILYSLKLVLRQSTTGNSY